MSIFTERNVCQGFTKWVLPASGVMSYLFSTFPPGLPLPNTGYARIWFNPVGTSGTPYAALSYDPDGFTPDVNTGIVFSDTGAYIQIDSLTNLQNLRGVALNLVDVELQIYLHAPNT